MISKLKKLIGILKEPLFVRALSKGTAAGVEHKKVLRILAKCSQVVDIGANRGQFALVSRNCFPDAVIISFEPLKEPAEVFERVFAGDDDTQLHRYAIGPEKSEAIIHVSNRDDSSSLLPIGEGQVAIYPETAEKETRVTQVVPLGVVLSETDIQTPALLKIDVQGFELQALEGCEDLLNSFAWVYVECSFVELYEGQAFADTVITWLRERGFALCGVYNMAYDSSGKAIQADFLFQNSESTGGL